MRLLLLWPWPGKEPNPSSGDDRITCFWPQGNDPSSLATSLGAKLNGGAFTHVMLHNALGQADWDVHRGIECPHGIEEVVQELLPLIGEPARAAIQQIAIYGHFPDDEFLDRKLQHLRRRLWFTLSDTLGHEPAELRERVHMLDTVHAFRQPQGLPFGVGVGLYTALVASLAKVFLNLGDDAEDANHYFRKENIEVQEFLHRLDRMRYLPAKRALNRFGVGAISAFGDLGSRDEYLLDSPFRYYYREINRHIETSPDELSAVFHEGGKLSGEYLNYALAVFDYCFDHETNRFVLTDLTSSTDLDPQQARLIRLLPMLHSSIYFCKADTWQSIPDDRRKPGIGKRDLKNRFRLAFVIASLESASFKGTMNFSMFERQYDKNAPPFKELEASVEELLIPVLKAKVMATLVGPMEKEAERHALNSAITQTAARNYAHHIGAHVKMRTTPQEIKKRIKELYTGQFNGI